uniref:Major facilitator superfamily (MFS) profile domain-containing protein n=1 Tax=Tetranychus urticae TaxID=32264 RepID=T1KWM5_TETUR
MAIFTLAGLSGLVGVFFSHDFTLALWSAFAYYIANWKLIGTVFGTIISIFTPESVRCWINGKQVPEDVLDSIIIRKPAPFHLKEFLNYPRLCRNFMFAGILSILNGISFIGTNLYAAVLLKNPFLVLSLNAFIDAIACLVFKNLAHRYGRKRIMLISRAVSTRLCLNNFGAFIAPFVISLHSYGSYIPPTVIKLTSAVSGLLVLFLPETLGVPLPETCPLNLLGWSDTWVLCFWDLFCHRQALAAVLKSHKKLLQRALVIQCDKSS